MAVQANAAPGDPSTRLVSRQSQSAGGAGGNLNSSDPAVSASGRFVAFESDATNLSGAAQDGVRNIYVYDRERKRVELVSRQSNGAGGAGADTHTEDPAISASGRYVTFDTTADNLGGPTVDDIYKIYRYDRKLDKVRLISRQSQSAGGDGADAASNDSQISGSGRFVAFESDASNLGGPIDAVPNVYVYDTKRRKVELVSRQSRSSGGAGGDQYSETDNDGGGGISRSGRFVAFSSQADNLGGPIDPAFLNVYVYDRKRERVSLVSRRSRNAGGAGGDDSSEAQVISASGRFVAFETEADNLGGAVNTDNANVYVYDRKRKRTTLLSRQSQAAGGAGGNDDSESPAISGSGRFVAFASVATNLGGPIDVGSNSVYVYDRKRRKVVLVSRQSRAAGNLGANDDSNAPSISAAGRFVAFDTSADNLGGPLDPAYNNVYMRDRGR